MPMRRRLITITGTDRPGLIAAIAEVLAAAGADLEDVTMTRLEGNFAMMLVSRGGDDVQLEQGLARVAQELGLFTHVQPAVEQSAEELANAYVSAVGPNRVGIVAAIAGVLARHGANIVEMSTRLLEKTAVPVYLVRIEAVTGEETEGLRRDLAAAGAQLGIEVRLELMERVDL